MARIEGPKYTGGTTFDLTAVQDELRDVPPGGLRGARGAGEDLDSVLAELSSAIPKYGDALEVHPALFQRIVDTAAKLDILGKAEVFYTKLLEVIVESRTRLENNREEDIGEIGTRAEKAGTKGKQPEMLSHFEKTIQYKARTGDKAAATRKKNEEEAKAKAEADAKANPKQGGGQPA
jgi:hypothetical protein